jgi:hypothetical protein
MKKKEFKIAVQKMIESEGNPINEAAMKSAVEKTAKNANFMRCKPCFPLFYDLLFEFPEDSRIIWLSFYRRFFSC